MSALSFLALANVLGSGSGFWGGGGISRVVGVREDTREPWERTCSICKALPGQPCTNLGKAAKKGRLWHKAR